ncbi:class F sortase [Ornithinimicrobium pratense]|uniref:Class F sortase n=1 Tax=Ornithinimicrobium pratense TaxID=2593973 RepID=A0A5J6V2M1_9MICO|nr:class F sortase [Ornithinimicrobium pratense]QFG67401.1 class F sortase [Ornithinimicrobium pratense]
MADERTHGRRRLWWAVLAGGYALLVAAVVLALATRTPADFTENPSADGPAVNALAALDDGTAATAAPQGATDPDELAGRVGLNRAVAPASTRTVPLVPEEARRPATAPERTATTAPVGLEIPAVDITVDVVPVGVDVDGQMEIPASGFDVGWYRYGAAPGEGEGSAVLASHVDTLAAGKGVLARLTDLRAGDLVSVTLEDGSAVDYQVTGRRTVPKAELDVGMLFDRSGPAQLRLVTCGGPWQPERSGYRDNVIVTAAPVPAAS